MPCRSEYLAPNQREIESQRVAENIVWLSKKLNIDVEDWVVKSSKSTYGNIDKCDKLTDILCHLCQKPEADEIIYNGRNPHARRVADWWDRHKKFDLKRIKDDYNFWRNKVNELNSDLAKAKESLKIVTQLYKRSRSK